MTLKQLAGVRSHAVLKGLYEDEPVREFVVRALGDVRDEIDDTGKEIFLQALRDENPRVRLRAIIALARSGDASAAAAILPLARDQKMIADGRVDSAEKSDAEDDWSAPVRAIPHIALKAVVKLNAVDLLLDKLDDPELG